MSVGFVGSGGVGCEGVVWATRESGAVCLVFELVALMAGAGKIKLAKITSTSTSSINLLLIKLKSLVTVGSASRGPPPSWRYKRKNTR